MSKTKPKVPIFSINSPLPRGDGQRADRLAPWILFPIWPTPLEITEEFDREKKID